jgi:hypothetical protein
MRRVHIKVGELFGVDTKFTVHLIRLMAAANDLTTIASCYIQLTEPDDEAARSRIAGQRVYFFRLAHAHLFEAIEVLKKIGTDCPKIVDQVPGDFHAKYNRIATTFDRFSEAFGRLRAHAAFHYDFSEIEDVLREWGADAEGEVVLGSKKGEIRYGVADDAMTRVISRAFNLPPMDTEQGRKAAKQFLDEILPLQFDLIEFVLGLLAAGRKVYPNLISVVEQSGVVGVDPQAERS